MTMPISTPACRVLLRLVCQHPSPDKHSADVRRVTYSSSKIITSLSLSAVAGTLLLIQLRLNGRILNKPDKKAILQKPNRSYYPV